MVSEKEYKFLRDEMINNYKHIQSDYAILYASIGAILVFALKPEIHYIICLLIPWFIILPLYLKIESQHRHIAKIGAYLYVFHEGEDFNWERRHHDFEEKYYRMYESNKPALFYRLVFFCCFATFYKCSQDYETAQCAININWEAVIYITHYIPYLSVKYIILLIKATTIILFVIPVIIIIRGNHVNYIVFRNLYIREWEEIKEEEMQKRTLELILNR